jgi:hypothetical protein
VAEDNLTGDADCFFLGFPVSKPARVNFVESLIAVLAGNLIYFLLMPYLPPAARHTHRYDLGVVVDFWICLVVFGLIKTFNRWGRRSREQQQR